MPDLILRDIDPERLRAEIAADVIAAMRPLLAEASEPRLVDRERMAELLSVSVPFLDRMRTEKELPSITLGKRRLFDPAAVIAALNDDDAKPKKAPRDDSVRGLSVSDANPSDQTKTTSERNSC